MTLTNRKNFALFKVCQLTFFLIIIFLVWHCTKPERNNIYDSQSENYLGKDSVDLIKQWAGDCEDGIGCLEKALNNQITLEFISHQPNDTIDTSFITLKGKINCEIGIPIFKINGKKDTIIDNTWTYDLTLSANSNEVKFLAYNSKQQVLEKSIILFFSDIIPPEINVVGAINNEIVVSADNILLAWKVKDISEITTVRIDENDASFRSRDSIWSYPISLSNTTSSYQLEAIDVHGNKNSETIIIHLDYDISGPIIKPIYPKDANEVVSNSHITVKIEVTDSSGITSVFIIGKNNGKRIVLEKKSLYYEADINLNFDGTEFKIEAIDQSLHKNKTIKNYRILYNKQN